MDKVKTIISELTTDERQRLFNDLLVQYCKTLQGEVCVLDEKEEVIGIIMPLERWEDLIDPEVLNRLPVDRSKCRPKAEFMKEIRAKLAAKELQEKLEAQV